jgi:phenylalanyl-tRNA synthetase alpha chain
MASLDDIAALRAEFDRTLDAASSVADLRAIRDRFLSRKHGSLNAVLKALGQASADERRAIGSEANALRQVIEATLDERERALAAGAPPPEAIDVTLPGRTPPVGRRHPLTQIRERIEQIFAAMGYYIATGPELEDDWHNFEALNMPAEHPARDMQDTLYLQSGVPQSWAPTPGASPDRSGAATPQPGQAARPATLLRTHTSGMQIRYMATHEPPVRIIAPGRVYRRDNFDATHTPMFTQVEGLVVDERISLGDLKGTLTAFAQRLFDTRVRTRFRPSFFPYTEPSAEMDVSCGNCDGAGCPLCKHTGWIEVLGCGMVHPAVFEAVGYDTERYTGFAFGVGIERLALRFYGLDDIRMFYENDLRFLRQLPL